MTVKLTQRSTRPAYFSRYITAKAATTAISTQGLEIELEHRVHASAEGVAQVDELDAKDQQ